MNQSRLTFQLQQDQVPRNQQSLIENLVEDDGFPVAAFEVDENTGLWAISVYTDTSETDRYEKPY